MSDPRFFAGKPDMSLCRWTFAIILIMGIGLLGCGNQNSTTRPETETTTPISKAALEEQIQKAIREWRVPETHVNAAKAITDSDFGRRDYLKAEFELLAFDSAEELRLKRIAGELVEVTRSLEAVLRQVHKTERNSRFRMPSAFPRIDAISDEFKLIQALAGVDPKTLDLRGSDVIRLLDAGRVKNHFDILQTLADGMPIDLDKRFDDAIKLLMDETTAAHSMAQRKRKEAVKTLEIEKKRLLEVLAKNSYAGPEGKTYSSREERNNAVKEFIGSSRFRPIKNSSQPQNSKDWRVHVRLYEARDRNQFVGVNRIDQQRFVSESEDAVSRWNNTVKDVNDFRLRSQEIVGSIEESREWLQKTRSRLVEAIGLHLKESITKVSQATSRLQLPRADTTLFGLGVEKPQIKISPQTIERPRGNTTIAGTTHRVEGDLFFLENKVIKIPPILEDFYIQGPRIQGPNEVVIVGSFDFVKNAEGTLLARPIELYHCPAGMLEYAIEFRKREAEKSIRDEFDAIYEAGEKRLLESTGDLRKFDDAFHSLAGASQERLWQSLDETKKAAAALLDRNHEAAGLTDVEEADIRNSIERRFATEMPKQFPAKSFPADDTKRESGEQTENAAQGPLHAKGSQDDSNTGRSSSAAESTDSPISSSLDPLFKAATDWKRDESGQLVSVAFHGVSISDEAIDVLVQQRSVTKLHLAEATISDGQLVRLGELENLEWLILWGSNIGPSGVNKICEQNPKLKYLSLTGTKGLTNETAKSISKLPLLERLAIGWCNANDRQLAEFATMPKLTTLNIVSSRCSFGGLMKLRECKSLRKLVITGIKPALNDRQRTGLAEALPEVSIGF